MEVPISTAAVVSTHDAKSYMICMPNTAPAWQCCRKSYISIDGGSDEAGCLVHEVAVLVDFKTCTQTPRTQCL
jgi:hypothetical protein